MLLDIIYLKVKEEVDYLLEANNMINIVSDESNNQVGNRILNMIVFTKNQKSFYVVKPSYLWTWMGNKL